MDEFQILDEIFLKERIAPGGGQEFNGNRCVSNSKSEVNPKVEGGAPKQLSVNSLSRELVSLA